MRITGSKLFKCHFERKQVETEVMVGLDFSLHNYNYDVPLLQKHMARRLVGTPKPWYSSPVG
jgi:hypothetical protein